MTTDRDYLLQRDIGEWLSQCGSTPWQTVYDVPPTASGLAVFSALVDPKLEPSPLESNTWEVTIGAGTPSFSGVHDDGKWQTHYEPHGGKKGFRAFVHARSFPDPDKSHLEVCEEFRLLFNLYEDRHQGLLLDFDESGYDIPVLRFSDSKVEVHLRYLKRFLAATQLSMLIYVDSIRYSALDLSEFREVERNVQVREPTYCCGVRISDNVHSPGQQSASLLMGKALIVAPPVEQSGFWPYDDKTEDYPEFVTGLDIDGNPKHHTCDPNTLADYFGKNPSAPHYLTPVFFRKEVLQKYYADTSRYLVDDGCIRCKGLWLLRLDNNHEKYVIAYLGDLGRDLPQQERLNWKQFNVAPDGQVSEVDFKRNFLAQFTSPTAPDLMFRTAYAALQQQWAKRFGWTIHLPPEPGDGHLLTTLRVPVTQGQSEFDDQVLVLTRLLVDFLNEAAIVAHVGRGPEKEKGISKVSRLMQTLDAPDFQRHVKFLRALQELRSTGSGHRKGSSYETAFNHFAGSTSRRTDAFLNILGQANDFIALLQGLTGTSDTGRA